MGIVFKAQLWCIYFPFKERRCFKIIRRVEPWQLFYRARFTEHVSPNTYSRILPVLCNNVNLCAFADYVFPLQMMMGANMTGCNVRCTPMLYASCFTRTLWPTIRHVTGCGPQEYYWKSESVLPLHCGYMCCVIYLYVSHGQLCLYDFRIHLLIYHTTFLRLYHVK